MTEPRTHTLEVPGATLTFDVRRSDPSGERILLLIGSPMGAAGFTTLSRPFTDRTVVTSDPGSERSVRTDGAAQSTPVEHADDLHRLISALDAGPVDIFHHPRHSLRAGLRRPSCGIDPHRPRCRGRVRRRAAQPRCACRGRTAREEPDDIPEQPRRVPWRRVWTDRRPRCLCGDAARHTHRALMTRSL
jgi:hypothetical protein